MSCIAFNKVLKEVPDFCIDLNKKDASRLNEFALEIQNINKM